MQVILAPHDILTIGYREFIDKCIETYNELDVMVLNAGINAYIKFSDMKDLDHFHRIIQTNFFGYLYCTKSDLIVSSPYLLSLRYALPYLKKNKGQFIVLSSFSGEVGLPYRVAYCASKFAVTGFFESLRIEMNNHDVAITIICPPSVFISLCQ